jgi:hypothetical protein
LNAQKNAEQTAAREAGVGAVQLAPPSAAAPAAQTRRPTADSTVFKGNKNAIVVRVALFMSPEGKTASF